MSLGENILLLEGREGEKPLLVISIHPKQLDFVSLVTLSSSLSINEYYCDILYNAGK